MRGRGKKLRRQAMGQQQAQRRIDARVRENPAAFGDMSQYVMKTGRGIEYQPDLDRSPREMGARMVSGRIVFPQHSYFKR